MTHLSRVIWSWHWQPSPSDLKCSHSVAKKLLMRRRLSHFGRVTGTKQVIYLDQLMDGKKGREVEREEAQSRQKLATARGL